MASAERQAEIRRELIPQLEALAKYSVDGLTSESLAQLFAEAHAMVAENAAAKETDLANGGKNLNELREGQNEDIETVKELLDNNQDLLDVYKQNIDNVSDFVDAEIKRVEALKAERNMVDNVTEAYKMLTDARNAEGNEYAQKLGMGIASDSYGQEGRNIEPYIAELESYKVLQQQALEDVAKMVYGSASEEILKEIMEKNGLNSTTVTTGQVLRFASGGYTGD